MDPFWELVTKLPFGIIFFFIVVRVMGLKEMSQSNAVDFAFAVLAASIIWDMSFTQGFKLWQMAVVMVLMSSIIFLIDWISSFNRKFEKAVYGEPQILIFNGQVNEELLEKERISINELKSRLRVLGYFNIEEIEIAYLEVSGQISVKRRSDK